MMMMVLMQLLPELLSMLGSAFKWLLIGGVSMFALSKASDFLGGASKKMIESKQKGGKGQESKEWYSLQGIKDSISEIWNVVSNPIDSAKKYVKDEIKEELLSPFKTQSSQRRYLRANSEQKLVQHLKQWVMQNKTRLGISEEVFKKIKNSTNLEQIDRIITERMSRLEAELKPHLKGKKIQDIEWSKLYSAVPTLDLGQSLKRKV